MRTLADVFVRIRPTTKGFGAELKKEAGTAGGAAGSAAGSSFTDRMGKDSKAGSARAAKDASGEYKKHFTSGLSGVGKAMAASFVVAGGVSLFGGMIAEAREAEKIGRLTESTIKATGGAAGVTADEVSKLADSIARSAGVDDDLVQSGANMLLTFKDIKNVGTNKIFDEATMAATDMTAAMNNGQVTQEGLKTSSIQIGKALNDPIQGMSALSRVGVTFNDAQKDQIKTMVESGDKMGAQKVILQELKSEFGGAAEAAADPAQKAKVAWQGFQESLGQAVLPMVNGLANAFAAMAPFIAEHAKLILGIVAAFVAAVVAVKAYHLVSDLAKGAMLIWKGITLGATAAQWLFNAALHANPIGIVILAVMALIAAVILLWKNSETFRNIVIGAWNGIKAAVEATVNWLVTVAWPFIQQVWQGIATGALWLWHNVIGPAFNGIRVLVEAAWGWIVNTGWPALQGVFRAIGTVVGWLWNTVIKPGFEGWKIIIQAAWSWITTTGWPALKAVFNGIGVVVGWLWNNVVKPAFDGWKTVISAAWNWIANTGWPILKAVFSAIGAVISAWWNGVVKPIWTAFKNTVEATFNWIVNTGWPILRGVFGVIGAVISAWWNNVVKPIWTALKNTVEATFSWIVNTGWPILRGVFGVIGAVISAWWNNVVKPIWTALKNTVEATFNWIVNTGWPFLRGVFQAIGAAVKFLWDNVIKPSFDGWKILLSAVWGWIRDTAWPFLRGVFDAISAAVKFLWNNIIKPSFEGWKTLLGAVWGWIRDTAWPFLKAVFEAIAAVVRWLWENIFRPAFNGIKAVIEAVWNWISNTAWPFIKRVFEAIAETVRILWDKFKEKFDFIKGKVESVIQFFTQTVIPAVRTAFDNIKEFVTTLWNNFREKFDQIRDKVTGVLDGVKSAFRTAVDAIKTTWEKVKEAVRTPINYVINPVYAKIKDFWNAIVGKVGLNALKLPDIAQMARGGIYPGYTPGRDIGMIAVSGGEAVMRPEWTRGVGAKEVHRQNRIARTGGASAIRRYMGGFADGGIIGDIKGFFGKAKDFVLGNLLKVAAPVISGIRGLINGIPGQGDMGRVAKAMPNMLLDKAIEFLKTKDVSPDSGLWAGGGIPGISSWLRAQDRKPYIWAAAGPSGYDCSGIVSAVWNLVKGLSPYRHTFSTSNQAGYFTDPPGGLFEAGWANPGERGGGSVGHTAARFNDIPFEAGGNNGNVSVARSGITPLSDFAHRGSMPRAAELIGAHLVNNELSGLSGDRSALMQRALGIVGRPVSWISFLNTLITRESNWNPRAINLTDTNAARGDPSRGLMQLIGATFNGYRLKSLSSDIYDPLANIVAGLRYIIAVYGSIFNVQQANASLPPKGYKSGGVVGPSDIKRADRGGWLQPKQFAYNGTRKPELMTPADTPIRLHPKDLKALGEIIGSHVGRAIGSFGTATARSADLIARS